MPLDRHVQTFIANVTLFVASMGHPVALQSSFDFFRWAFIPIGHPQIRCSARSFLITNRPARGMLAKIPRLLEGLPEPRASPDSDPVDKAG
jgi:hypothetical protein